VLHSQRSAANGSALAARRASRYLALYVGTCADCEFKDQPLKARAHPGGVRSAGFQVLPRRLADKFEHFAVHV